MGYADILSNMIQESGLSLRQIADRCKDMGHTITPSYISKLQSGKQAPASEDVSKAIAQACNQSPDLLIWEGYMEKAPDIIRDYVNATLPILKKEMLFAIKSMFPPEHSEKIYISLENLSPIEFIKMIKEEFNNKNLSSSLIDTDTLKIIDSDKPDFQFELSKHIGIPVTDDSMHPTIPFNAVIKTAPLNNIPEDGTIVAINFNSRIYIRRYNKYNGLFIFIADNPKYLPLILKESEFHLLGLVKTFTLFIF